MHFNVTYSDAHLLGANSTLRLGDLRVCGVSDMPQFNNLTVRQVLAFANQVLGFVITLNDNDYEPIALFVERLTESFESGTVSVFAQRHLVNGICASGWSSGAVITYGQESWGTSGTTAATLLGNEFDSVYIGGAVEIGVPGAGTSAVFTTSDAVLAYLPADGAPAPLSHDLANPTSTSSGVFGGFVLALQLAVDFADAGHLARTSAVRVGDLTVCSLTDTPLLNGLTVRQLLAIANQVLGGSSSPNDFDHLSDLVQALSQSFESGIPNSFAQQHLVAGACPS